MFFLRFPKHLSIWKLKPFIKEPIALSCKVKKRGTPERMPQPFNQKMPPIAGGLLLAS